MPIIYDKDYLEGQNYYMFDNEMYRKLKKNKYNPNLYNLYVEGTLRSYSLHKLKNCYNS